MTNDQWFAMVIMAMWTTTAVGAMVTRDSSIYLIPAVMTLLLCMGYYVFKLICM